MKKYFSFVVLLLFSFVSLAQVNVKWNDSEIISLLQDKRVGLVCNHTSLLDVKQNPRQDAKKDILQSSACKATNNSFEKHLKEKRINTLQNTTKTIHRIDYLLGLGIELKTVFTPEHGLTGLADAGVKVNDSTIRDGKILVRSLYGNSKKPKKEWLKDIDVMIFDLQDVGCRFYTYISTLEYVMQACIESNIPLVVYDRPNPNNYVDGPVLEKQYRSFVGMQPIPVCYGLTMGEYANMINQEHWVNKDLTCELYVATMQDYKREEQNSLPVPPSPNLRTLQSIKNYPTLCFFEGTPFSVGRGTDTPFEKIGFQNPKNSKDTIWFEIKLEEKKIDVQTLIDMYKKYPYKDKFFAKFFDTLAGTDKLRKQIQQGKTAAQIRESWQKDLEEYLKIRDKYLLYF